VMISPTTFVARNAITRMVIPSLIIVGNNKTNLEGSYGK
jgi:hypothetical protein